MARDSLKEDGRPAQQWYWDDWFSSHDVQSCSFEAQGLWINMLGIMFTSEIRGTLTINGIQMDNKSIAKRFKAPIEDVNRLIAELEEEQVFSRLDDGTIYSRRMYRESNRKEEISRIRSRAGKKGMEKRWKSITKHNKKNPVITNLLEEIDNKPITNITASSSSPTPTPTSKPKKPPYVSPPKKDKYREIRHEVIKYLNEKTGKNFNPDLKATIKVFNGRLNNPDNPATLEEMKRVIDVKCHDWLKTENNKYLRPETLFGEKKFESYRNEKIVKRYARMS